MVYKLGISLLTYNFPELTAMTLNSLKHSVDVKCILDIQDDGSDPVNHKMLSSMTEELATKHMHTINVEYGTNQGLIKARNESYRRLLDKGCEYIAIIHNDMMFGRGMFSEIISMMHKAPNFGILAAETIKDKGTSASDFQDILDNMQYAASNSKAYEIFRGNNHPAIMRSSALREVLIDGKVYDETFGRCDNEDIDLLGRLEDAGYLTLVTKRAWGYHQGEASRSVHPDTQQHKDHSRSVYERKWKDLNKLPWEYR